MSRFSDIVKDTTPRFVIEEFTKKEGDEEQRLMRWYITGCGEIERTGAIAAIIRAQTSLSCVGAMEWWDDCPLPMLVIAWPSLDKSEGREIPSTLHPSLMFLNRTLNEDHVITMLEIAKSSMLAGMLIGEQNRKAQEAQAQVQLFKESDQQAFMRLRRNQNNN